MRTTLTIEESIAKRLKERANQKKISFKEVVNEVLQRGLEHSMRKKDKLNFTIEGIDMGTKSSADFDNIGEILDLID